MNRSQLITKVEDEHFLENITCGICRKLMYDPLECHWCSANFCLKCIDSSLKNVAEKCPVHLGPLRSSELRTTNDHVKECMSKVMVKCPDEFCGKIMKLSDFRKHVRRSPTCDPTATQYQIKKPLKLGTRVPMKD